MQIREQMRQIGKGKTTCAVRKPFMNAVHWFSLLEGSLV